MMRRGLKWIVPTLVMLCVVLSVHEAQAGREWVFVSGNDLVKWMGSAEQCDSGGCGRGMAYEKGKFWGFIVGIHDATADQYDMPEETQLMQLPAIVSKYLKEHPERWSYSAVSLVIDAFKEAFPKSQGKQQPR